MKSTLKEKNEIRIEWVKMGDDGGVSHLHTDTLSQQPTSVEIDNKRLNKK